MLITLPKSGEEVLSVFSRMILRPLFWLVLGLQSVIVGCKLILVYMQENLLLSTYLISVFIFSMKSHDIERVVTAWFSGSSIDLVADTITSTRSSSSPFKR